MIRLLTNGRLNEFSAFCDKRLTGAVIYTRLKTYGIFSNDVFFWYSENTDNEINAVFSMADGIFLACTDGTADEEEIRLFSQTVGAAHITYGNAEYTLKFISSQKNFTAEDISGENIKDVFDVIFEDDDSRNLYFPEWYTDASHKIRHGFIHGKCIYEGNKCVAVAMTSGETDSIAVISSVATLRNYRKQGFGERVVLSLAQSLDKEVYLMTDNEKTMLWYEKMGFNKQ